MKRTVRSWPMILLLMFTVAMLGFTAILVVVLMGNALGQPWLNLLAAAIMLGPWRWWPAHLS